MQYHIPNSLAISNGSIWSRTLGLLVAGLWLGAGLAHSAVEYVPQARSAFAPSAAVFNGKTYLSWRGSGSPGAAEDDQKLYLATREAGVWTEPQVLSGRSMFGPVLAASSDQLFIAWHGEGNLFSGTGDPAAYFASMRQDGEIQYAGVVPGPYSAGPPGLAVFNGLVYLSWRAYGNVTVGTVPGNHHWINYKVFDPQAGVWLGKPSHSINIVHANGTSGPTLAPVGERLYAVWRGTGSLTFLGPNSDPGDPLLYHGFFDGETWSTFQLPLPIIPKAQSAWTPGAVAWGGGLLVGWRGDQPRGKTPGNPALSFALLQGDDEWRSVNLFGENPPGSAFGPAMAVDPNGEVLQLFWRGVFDRASGEDDQQIYTATFSELPGDSE